MHVKLSVSHSCHFHTTIDRVHAIHADGKGYSSMYMTMRRGARINVSKKLGLIAISSTEAEIVVNREYFPKYTWLRYFSLAQRDSSKEGILM